MLCCDLNSLSFSLCFPLVTLIIRYTQVDLSFIKSCFPMQPVRHLKVQVTYFFIYQGCKPDLKANTLDALLISISNQLPCDC